MPSVCFYCPLAAIGIVSGDGYFQAVFVYVLFCGARPSATVASG